MLQLGDDWQFSIDQDRSTLWLGPRGEWGFEVVCESRQVATSDGLQETLAPRLRVEGLMLEGVDWRELVGLEIYQRGAWRGEGEPHATLQVMEQGELTDARMAVTAVEGNRLRLSLEARADVFVDDDHDTNVPLSLDASVPFEGVRFRFRADGADSRDPKSRAIQLLAMNLSPSGFGPPTIEAEDEPGVFAAHFPPAAEGEGLSVETEEVLQLSPEERLLHQSAKELLEGMEKQEWLELEDSGARTKLVPGFVEVLEEGGRGTRRAGRVVDWLIDQDGVVDVMCSDDDLAAVLDKFW